MVTSNQPDCISKLTMFLCHPHFDKGPMGYNFVNGMSISFIEGGLVQVEMLWLVGGCGFQTISVKSAYVKSRHHHPSYCWLHPIKIPLIDHKYPITYHWHPLVGGKVLLLGGSPALGRPDSSKRVFGSTKNPTEDRIGTDKLTTM